MTTGSASNTELSELLARWSRGDRVALERLLPLVEVELHRLARRYMRRERAGHTLQTTALVNEAYLRLVDQRDVSWQNRAHFFAIAAQMMRRILVDHARRRGTRKHGGGAREVSLEEAAVLTAERSGELVALDDALTQLEKLDARKSRVVELRYFGGLTLEEAAAVLGISADTASRDWRRARAWLHRELTRAS